MEIEFDFEKRDKTFKERGLDFSRATEVFAGVHYTGQDTRMEYAEDRFITVGTLKSRVLVLVWTQRGEIRRIISTRKANEREKAIYASYLD